MPHSTIGFWHYGQVWGQRLLPPHYETKYNIVANEYRPDIIWISDQPEGTLWAFYTRICRARLRYGWRPVLYCVIGENQDIPYGLDFTFSFRPATERNCLRSPVIFKPGFKSVIDNRYDGKIRKWCAMEKTQFCCFIYTDDRHPQTRVRRDFCKLLARYKAVACPAGSLNNRPRIHRRSRQAKIDFMAECKFSIAFEHTSYDHYLTEKIYDAFCAGSIPIYWGCPQVAEYYNPEAFINCHDYKTFEEVIERVKEIDNSPELWRQYLNAPPVLPGSRFYTMMKNNERHVDKMIDMALNRREKKKSRVRDILCLVHVTWAYPPQIFLRRLRIGRKLLRLRKKYQRLTRYGAAVRSPPPPQLLIMARDDARAKIDFVAGYKFSKVVLFLLLLRGDFPDVGFHLLCLRYDCSPFKVVRELGSERRETVRSLSAVGV